MQGQIHQSHQNSRVQQYCQHLDYITDSFLDLHVQIDGVKVDLNFKNDCWKVQFHLERSENCVKNKFYGSLRKAVRSLNMQFRSACQKSKKQMRFKSIMRVLEYAEGRYRIQPALMRKSVELREILLEMTINQQISISDEEVMKLVSEINDFSIAIRSYKVVKIPKHCPIEGDSMMRSDQIYMQDNELKQKVQKTCYSQKSQGDQMQLVGSLNKQNDNQQAKILSGECKKQYQEEQNKHLADLVPLPIVDDNEKINKWEQMLMDHFFSQPHSPLDIEDIF